MYHEGLGILFFPVMLHPSVLGPIAARQRTEPEHELECRLLTWERRNHLCQATPNRMSHMAEVQWGL